MDLDLEAVGVQLLLGSRSLVAGFIKGSVS